MMRDMLSAVLPYAILAGIALVAVKYRDEIWSAVSGWVVGKGPGAVAATIPGLPSGVFPVVVPVPVFAPTPLPVVPVLPVSGGFPIPLPGMPIQLISPLATVLNWLAGAITGVLAPTPPPAPPGAAPADIKRLVESTMWIPTLPAPEQAYPSGTLEQERAYWAQQRLREITPAAKYSYLSFAHLDVMPVGIDFCLGDVCWDIRPEGWQRLVRTVPGSREADWYGEYYASHSALGSSPAVWMQLAKMLGV